MKSSHLTAAALGLLIAGAGFAVAQQQQPPNVSQNRSICAQGYESAVRDGVIGDRAYSKDTLKSVDTNNDGRISKSEFDNACARNLFKRTEKDAG